MGSFYYSYIAYILHRSLFPLYYFLLPNYKRSNLPKMDYVRITGPTWLSPTMMVVPYEIELPNTGFEFVIEVPHYSNDNNQTN